MKVLHIGKYFPPYAGGMENYLRDLMATQGRQGMNPSALVHKSDISFTSQQENYHAGDQTFPVTRAAVWARLLFTPLSPTFPWLLSRLIRQTKPDILHLHMPNASVFWALLLPGARRIPWVVHWHADVPASTQNAGLRFFYTLYQPLERAVLNRCRAIIATSPPYLDSSKALQAYLHKSHVIPLGVTPVSPPRMSLTETAPDPAAPLRVLAVGRLTYYKGFEFLIRAAKHCEEFELHLVGRGEQETSLKALTRDLKLDNRVTFHGHLPDDELARQFNASGCLCLPSIERTEAFGMVLLEAMYHGKATVISDVPGSGMGWVVEHGITGLKVEPGSSQALADALGQLANDRARVQAMGQRGQQKFDVCFHINQSAASVAALYHSLLETAQDPLGH